MTLVAKDTTIPTADGPMGVSIRRPEGDGPFPVLVLFHHGPGLDTQSHQAMNLLAEHGYYVASSDRYHRLGLFHTFAIHRADGSFDSEVMAQAREALIGTDDETVARDLIEVLRMLADDPAAADQDNIRGVGYCVGARSLIHAMADRPGRFARGVAFHPSFCVTPEQPAPGATGILTGPSPHQRVSELTTERLLLLIGSEDQIASFEMNAALVEAVEALPDGRGKVTEVRGGDHGFALPGHAWADGASDDAYAEAIEFLNGR